MQLSLDATGPDAAGQIDEPRSPGNGPLEPTVSTRSVAGVTLVWIELRSTVAVDVRVRIRNELDGPILPPRAAGVPATGWDADGFSGAVPGSGSLGVGYACPASSPPDGSDATAVSIEVLGPVDGCELASDGTADEKSSDSVTAAIRSLGRARPPADVVVGEPGFNADDSLVGLEPDESAGRDGSAADAVPVAVEAWLDAVETRVEHAERLTDATAADATAVLADRGGADALVGLPEAIAADEATLRAVASRVADLADRADATDAAPVVSSLSAAAETRCDPNAESATERRAGPEAESMSGGEP
ncbi:hypothetical protein [Halobellus salinisoli]|uniref:DUF7857 domain-containing protein n=1 Tax=Halobellus salinisoli TaxID=3108500 RepID=UPI0030086D24